LQGRWVFIKRLEVVSKPQISLERCEKSRIKIAKSRSPKWFDMVKLGLILGWKLAKSKTILDAVSHYRCDLDHPVDKADVQPVILKGPDPLPSRSQLLCDIQVVALATLPNVPSLKAQLWKMSAVSHSTVAESKQIYPHVSSQ
jgi:hypothetical protein